MTSSPPKEEEVRRASPPKEEEVRRVANTQKLLLSLADDPNQIYKTDQWLDDLDTLTDAPLLRELVASIAPGDVAELNRPRAGSTLVGAALEMKLVDVLRDLIVAGADVDSPVALPTAEVNEGHPALRPIQWAAQMGSVELAQVLVELGRVSIHVTLPVRCRRRLFLLRNEATPSVRATCCRTARRSTTGWMEAEASVSPSTRCGAVPWPTSCSWRSRPIRRCCNVSTSTTSRKA
jgi:hypothetical protein